MTYTLLTALATLSASALILAGCSRSLDVQAPDADGTISFEVAVEGEGFSMTEQQEGTKADLKNSFINGDKFTVYGYDGTAAVMNGVEVSYNGSSWSYTGGPHLWTKGKSLNFYAFYTSRGKDFGSKISSSGVASFTYCPFENGDKDLNCQTDYMFASYKGTGTDGKVNLNFSHPLASIQFKCGDSFDTSFGTINTIKIEGFYDCGTCTPSCGESAVTYTWSSQNYSSTAMLEQTANTTPASGATIGKPFVLIPGQNFSTSGRSLKVTLKNTTTGKTATGTLSQNATLTAGKTSVFKINFIDGDKISFDPVTVTAWGSNEGGSADAEEKLPYVEIGGIKWATKNLGAKRETDYGAYCAWGATEGFKPIGNTFSHGFYWDSAPFNNGSSEYDETYFNSVKNTVYPDDMLALEYDVANATLGSNWRLPTMTDFKGLLDNTDKTWQTDYNGYKGVNGFLFTSKDNPTISIFLPAAGYAGGIELQSAGSSGYYLSSTLSPNSSEYVYTLSFSNKISEHYTSRYCGFSVRPVYDDTE